MRWVWALRTSAASVSVAAIATASTISAARTISSTATVPTTAAISATAPVAAATRAFAAATCALAATTCSFAAATSPISTAGAMRRHTDRVHHHLHHICVLLDPARPRVRQRADELRAVCCIQSLPATFAAFSVSARSVGLQHDVSGVHGLRAFVRFRRGPASWVRRVRGVFALRPAVAAVAAAGSAIEALQHAA